MIYPQKAKTRPEEPTYVRGISTSTVKEMDSNLAMLGVVKDGTLMITHVHGVWACSCPHEQPTGHGVQHGEVRDHIQTVLAHLPGG